MSIVASAATTNCNACTAQMACTSAALLTNSGQPVEYSGCWAECARMCRLADAQVGHREDHEPRYGYMPKDSFTRYSCSDPKGAYMIRVSVEVCSGATTFRATVWAESIEVAVGLARARYPGAEATVVFPIEPEAFFAKSSQIDSDTILPETMKQAG